MTITVEGVELIELLRLYGMRLQALSMTSKSNIVRLALEPCHRTVVELYVPGVN